MDFLTNLNTHHDGYPLARIHNLVKFYHIFALLTIPVSIITLVSLSLTGIIFQVPVQSADHFMLAVIFWVAAILSLFIGIGLWLYAKAHRNTEVLITWAGYIYQTSFLWGPAICGTIAGIVGLAWYVYVPMILAALPGLILTFPTEKRWANLFREVES
jgi:hypothetical protein